MHVHEKGHAIEHVTSKHRQGLGAHPHLSSHPERSHREDRSEIEAANENESAVAISFFHAENPKAPIQYVIVRAWPVIDTPAPFVVCAARDRPRIHDPPFSV